MSKTPPKPAPGIGLLPERDATSDTTEPAVRGAWRRPLTALAIVALSAVAVNLFAGLLAGSLYPTVEAGDRNPMFRRGWPWLVESTRSRMATDTTDIVLISNSQGFAVEYEADQAYSRRLQHLLDDAGHSARIHNWSVYAASRDELTLLVAAADWIRADVVLLVTGPGNFPSRTRRSSYPSDVPQLITRSAIRRRVHGVGVRLPREVVLDAHVSRWLPAWRMRELPRSLLLALRSRLDSATGARPARFGAWFLRPGSTLPTPRRRSAVLKSLDLSRLESVGRLLEELPQAVWIDMPLHSYRDRTRDWFEDAMSTIDPDLELLDWSRKIPDSAFVTTSHLSSEGHRLMAEALFEHLVERGFVQ